MIFKLGLRQVPGQSMMAILSEQNCSIRLVQRRGKTYMDLMINDTYIWRGVICHDRRPILPHRRSNFTGNFYFMDLEGDSDPFWEKLETRFQLFYITDDVELPPEFLPRAWERV